MREIVFKTGFRISYLDDGLDKLDALIIKAFSSFDKHVAVGAGAVVKSGEACSASEAVRNDVPSSGLNRAGQLLDEHGNRILRLAYSYLHNYADAEDILQETLIQYIKTSPQLEGSEHEKAWLLTVASNLSKNRIKYNKVRECDELMEELVAGEEEDLSFVWEAVMKLPVKYREAIHLFYEEGMSTKEIAEILDRNEATVRSDLLRGRQQLKEILKEAYDFE